MTQLLHRTGLDRGSLPLSSTTPMDGKARGAILSRIPLVLIVQNGFEASLKRLAAMRLKGIVVRGMMTAFALILTFVVLFSSDPNSAANFAIDGERQAFHDHIVASALAYVSRIPSTMTMPRASIASPTTSSHPHMSIVIMTALRPEVPYIHVLFWSLVTGGNDLTRTSFTIINSDSNPEANTDVAVYRRIPGVLVRDVFADKTLSYFQPSTVLSVITPLSDWISRQFLAHLYALDACIDDNAPLCVLFEDDALASRDLLSMINDLLDKLPRPSLDQHHLMIKLFLGDYGNRQAFEWTHRWTLFWYTVSGTAIVLLLLLITSMARSTGRWPSRVYRGYRTRAGFRNFAVVVAITFATVMVLLLIFTKQRLDSWLNWTPSTSGELFLSEHNDHWGNIANVYPRHSAIAMRDHLRDVFDNSGEMVNPIDYVVHEHALKNKWQLLSSSRSIVQHIGARSSNPLNKKMIHWRVDSRFVWTE